MKTDDGKILIFSGASRSGKTILAATTVGKPARAFAWDPEDQWSQLPGWQRVTRRADLLRAAQRAGPQRIAYVAGGKLAEEFNFWAGCVFYAGRYHGPLVCVAEELADVSTPNKAPANWGILIRRGLKRGIDIVAISQRWAEADKTALGNASKFFIFRSSTEDDAAYIARKTRIPIAEVNALKPLEFCTYDAHTGAIERSTLTFPRNKPTVKPRKVPARG